LRVGDLGEFELKGMRLRSATLTLGHKRPVKGLSPLQIFDRFGYVRPSRRDPTVLKTYASDPIGRHTRPQKTRFPARSPLPIAALPSVSAIPSARLPILSRFSPQRTRSTQRHGPSLHR
jgi:hypothetical protein